MPKELIPKISCVMPVRDRDEIVGEAIQSIRNQTEKDWELIIVDDHGKNHQSLKEIVDSFNDDRIRLFQLTDENGIGISAARNFGNMMAKSEYIAVMDSDDVAYENRFDLTLKAFRKEKCDVVYGEIDYWYPETGEYHKRNNEYRARPFDGDILQKLNYIAHPSSAYKTSIGLEFPYNSFFRKSEDYNFFLRLVGQKKKFHFIDESLIKYRKHAGSITKSDNFLFDYETLAKK